MTIGWGIIGAGEWADQNIAPAIRQAPGSRLVAVQSRTKHRAETFASYHGASRAYDDLDVLLRDPDIQVVFVGTPNHLHHEHVLAAARRGKHILCGVPLAVTTEDCVAMLEECNRHGVLLGVDFQHRHHPQFQALKATIHGGTIGEIVTVHAQASIPWEGGHRGRQVWHVPFEGAFADEYSQASMIRGREAWKETLEMRGSGILSGPGMLGLDVLRFVLASEVESVFATGDFSQAPRHQETAAVATLRFQNGVIATFECCRNTPFADNRFIVNGTKGRACTHGFTPWDSEGLLEVCTAEGTHTRTFHRGNMFVSHIEAMNRAVRDGCEPMPSGLDGFRERQVTLAIRQSALQKVLVKLG
jgi:1,5-anhydro-D-fructose reductase (1,5-anhydro-D-mannitol-forming)